MNKMKKSILMVIVLVVSVVVVAQEPAEVRKIVRLIADDVVADTEYGIIDIKSKKVYDTSVGLDYSPNLKVLSRYTDWRYWNGVLNIAMNRLGEHYEVEEYKNFAKNNVDFVMANYKLFEENFHTSTLPWWQFPFAQFYRLKELDDCGVMGASVIEVYMNNKEKKYKEYIDRAENHIMNLQDRLDDQTYSRTWPYEMTVWGDDLFMSIAFLSRMGKLTGDTKYFDEAAKQVFNFEQYLWDDNAGLYWHCWFNDVKQNGVAHWGRANGWMMVAKVELLSNLPDSYPQKDALIKNLVKQIIGISRYQGENGLWHQILDKSDSYFETSCSAMFVYSIARAINRGWLDKRYSSVVRVGWQGIAGKINSLGKVEGICAGTGIENDLRFYYQRPTPLNDIHGLGAIIMAGLEVEKLLDEENN